MVMKASTPITTTMTMAPANRGIGWSNGMAPQVSLPNMSIPRPCAGAGVGLGERTWPRRQRLIEDLPEQSVSDGAESERRRHDALLGELDIAFRRQLRSRGARLREPGGEVLRRLRHHLEMHVGESVAAQLAGQTAKGPRLVGREVELGPHAVHGVDHTA